MFRLILVILLFALAFAPAVVSGQTLFVKRMVFIANAADTHSALIQNLAQALVDTSVFPIPPDATAEETMLEQGTPLSVTQGGGVNRFAVEIALTQEQYDIFKAAIDAAAGNPLWAGYDSARDSERRWTVLESNDPTLIGFQFRAPSQLYTEAGFFMVDTGV